MLNFITNEELCSTVDFQFSFLEVPTRDDLFGKNKLENACPVNL